MLDLSAFPRLALSHGPTPLEPMARLSAHLGGPNLWIKRDDCTGLATGGNKTRKLEFLIAEAVAELEDTGVAAVALAPVARLGTRVLAAPEAEASVAARSSVVLHNDEVVRGREVAEVHRAQFHVVVTALGAALIASLAVRSEAVGEVAREQVNTIGLLTEGVVIDVLVRSGGRLRGRLGARPSARLRRGLRSG